MSRPTSPFPGHCAELLAAEQNDDFLIAAPEDYATVLDRLDRNLIGLGAVLQSKLLACLHRFSIDNGETPAFIIERDRTDDKGGGLDFGAVPGRVCLCNWCKADRPKWVATARFHGEG